MAGHQNSARAKAARTMRIDIKPSDSVEIRPVRQRSAESDSFAMRGGSGGEKETAFEKLLESVYDAVLITDRKGRVIELNTRTCEFFLLPRNRMLGTRVVDLISGADDALLVSIRNNLRDHRFTLIEARCTRADATSFPAEIAVNHVDLGLAGQLCFFVRDITVRKRAFEALEEAVKRLESYDRARSEFVSNVSHDLRTPLTSMIYAVTNMLRGVVGPLPERAVRYLERLDSDCRRLLATVNDILDLRHIENHSMKLALIRQPIGRLVLGCVESLRVQAEEKRVEVTCSFEPSERFVMCDPRKLERVLINILGNAIKFTPANGRIDVRVGVDKRDATQVLIDVCDSGIGIPPDAISKVTVRYFKVGEQPSGSGLGLAIAKEIVSLHEGTLDITSPVPGTDRGTAVTVRLPITSAPNVLIVDGDQVVCRSLCTTIEAHGYRTDCAGDVATALKRCRGGNVDVVLFDLRLPDMDGMQMVFELKRNKRFARMPLIASTDESLPSARAEMLRGFGIPVLLKPLHPEQVLEQLDMAFDSRGLFGRQIESDGSV